MPFSLETDPSFRPLSLVVKSRCNRAWGMASSDRGERREEECESVWSEVSMDEAERAEMFETFCDPFLASSVGGVVFNSMSR